MTAQLARLEHNYEGLTSHFQALNCAKQDEVLINAFNAVPNCLPATKDVYRFITPLATGQQKDKPIIPAMLVPAMLGMGYVESNDVENFKNRFLRKYGKEGVNWKFMNKRDLFSASSENKLVYKVPGKPSESIVVSKSAGNRAKWPFVTPRLAWRLIHESSKPIAKYFALLNHELVCILRERHTTQEEWEAALSESFELVDQTFVAPEEPDHLHDCVKAKVAELCNGKIEVTNRVGIADVESENAVFEIKPAHEWLHGIGQVLGYAFATKKQPVLVLYGEKSVKREVKAMCKQYKIDLVVLRSSKKAKRKLKRIVPQANRLASSKRLKTVR